MRLLVTSILAIDVPSDTSEEEIDEFCVELARTVRLNMESQKEIHDINTAEVQFVGLSVEELYA